MTTEIDHINRELHRHLHRAVEEHTYNNWLAPVRVERVSGTEVTAHVPPQIHPWVKARFGSLLHSALGELLGPGVTLDLLDAESGASAETPLSGRHQPASGAPRHEHDLPDHSRGLADDRPTGAVNPRLSFDHFVIGECNRLAHGAALCIAETPGGTYNPLHICGPPGVGKTHILHAMAAMLVAHNPGLVIRLTGSETFTSDFLSALHGNRIGEFKRRFRRVDVLMVDDIQFLERKTHTEEEFFHTFNALAESGAQVVLTSDRPPQDLEGFEARLRERFQGGLVANIAAPDERTRNAILHKQIADQRVPIADPAVVPLLVRRITGSVRALQGALIRVAAYASLARREIDAVLVEEVLDTLYGSDAPQLHGPPGPSGRTPSIVAIQGVVCEHFGTDVSSLLSSTRERKVAWARQVAMYLARDMTGESLPSIGRHFGGRDHTTVLYSCRRVERRVSADQEANGQVEGLRQVLAAQARGWRPMASVQSPPTA
ncbi:MAG: chromosomal replication initiator protein DnaA [Solirubrobacteraceae bacterium]